MGWDQYAEQNRIVNEECTQLLTLPMLFLVVGSRIEHVRTLGGCLLPECRRNNRGTGFGQVKSNWQILDIASAAGEQMLQACRVRVHAIWHRSAFVEGIAHGKHCCRKTLPTLQQRVVWWGRHCRTHTEIWALHTAGSPGLRCSCQSS